MLLSLKSFLLLVVAMFAFGSVGNAGEFSFKESPGELDILLDGKIVARFMHAYDNSTPEKLHDTYKPYLHVFDAAGEKPITKGPGGQFTHHRGIFVGWNKVTAGDKTVDLWHMKNVEQVHQKFARLNSNADSATFTAVINWNNTDDNPIMIEHRTMTVSVPESESQARKISIVSELKAISRDVELNGDPEHAGVQFRPANEVDKTKTVYYFPGKGTDPKKDLDLPWVAESFALDGKSYLVLMLNDSGNPIGTIYSAYRDYGRFGAFPKASIKEGETLTLKYQWLVAPGESELEPQLRRWLKLAEVAAAEGDITVKPVK